MVKVVLSFVRMSRGAVQYTGTDGTTIWWGFEAVSSTTHCFFVDSSTPRGGVQNSVCPVSFNIDTFSFEGTCNLINVCLYLGGQ